MKLKLFANLVFTFVGSSVLIVCFVIVGYNFFRDSRVLAAPANLIAKDEGTTKTPAEETDDSINQTQEYNRSVDSGTGKKPKPTPKIEETPEPSRTPDPSPTTIDDLITVKVEVLNYSGIKKIAESVRGTLEMNGYKVSAGNVKTNTPIVSQIIERNDSGAGTDLKNILKIGNVIKITDKNSRFDATVIIGDDYNP